MEIQTAMRVAATPLPQPGGTRIPIHHPERNITITNNHGSMTHLILRNTPGRCMEIQKPWGLRQLCYRNPEAQKIPIHHPEKGLQEKNSKRECRKSNKGEMSLIKWLKRSSSCAKVPKTL